MQRVALVGAGGMGRTHGVCYEKISNAKLVAVMDIRPEAAAAVAEPHGAQVFTDAEQMFSEVEFDVIDICTPTPLHLPYIKMGAAAGKHVSSEKPFGRTVDQCKEAIEVCEKAGVQLFVAHVVRWFPEFKRAHDLIKSGAAGTPSMIRTSRGGGFPGHSWNNWFSDYEWSGGVLLDLSIHDIDWLLWTFGPAEQVYAKGLTFSGVKEKDYALVTIRFKSGAIAHVEGSWATPDAFRVSFEIAGDEGLIEWSNQKTAAMSMATWKPEDEGKGLTVPSSPTAVSPYVQELSHFIECIETGQKPSVKPEEATAAVALCLAANESMKTGKPVKL